VHNWEYYYQGWKQPEESPKYGRSGLNKEDFDFYHTVGIQATIELWSSSLNQEKEV
jgi:hypothetical protein